MSKTLLVTIFVASSLMSRVVVAQDYTLAIATNRFTVGESVYVAWSTPPWSPGFFDWVGLYHASANDFNWVSYKYTLFRFDDTYFTVEEAGEYNFRYFVDNVLDKRATSSNFWVWPPAADLSLVRNYPSPPGPIIAFGDSLTAGVGASAGHDWPAIVSATLGIDIQNAGVSGDTTADALLRMGDRKSTRLNSSHSSISYAVFCLKKKKTTYSYDQKTSYGCCNSGLDKSGHTN